ncbi:CocE/NonD family hydrolase [Deltaproteobacteria bacterium]|nr:CocE/NonD family hydrolase [Deltaproteobacteria bacterium]
MKNTKYIVRHFTLAVFMVSLLMGCGQSDDSIKETNVVADSPTATETASKDTVEVIYKQLPPLDSPRANYAGFEPGTTILPKGYTYEEGRLPFPCDTVYERDVAVKLRDGVTIYADIYRPVGTEKVPAIVSWGPAGKRGQNNMLDNMGGGDSGAPARAGVPRSATSGLQGWESSDPAHWVLYGYATVNVDPRGAYMSEGICQQPGPQDGEDGYDFIEWLAVQEWCNGKIATAGNSWFAKTQYFIAATQPPHLAAIAPWEGWIDSYREFFVRGGIPVTGEVTWSYGGHLMEDTVAMIEKYPLMNSYWEAKIPKLENINVPAYFVGSYNSSFHVRGTYIAFNSISSEDKWLRVHNTHEWPDFYDEKNREDLRRFFDYYLKGIDNGWKETPKVRLSVFNPGGTDIVGRPENEFPMARQEPRELYLDVTSGNLSETPIEKESKVTYSADDGEGKVVFTIQFDEETEISGYIKLRLWVEADGADDMDLFAKINKLDNKGEVLFQDSILYKYSGPDGRLRVSHRQLDPQKSTPLMPYHTHTAEELLSPGEIVPVEIQIWPTGLLFHAGQQLQLVIAGYDYVLSAPGDRQDVHIQNKGNHVIHTGGKYDSYLLVPFIPPKKM